MTQITPMSALLNQAIIPVLNKNGMSIDRMESLIYLKVFVDRVSSRKYISDDELERLEKKYGAKPDVITWGDYFQCEIATTHAAKTDEELIRSVDTVRFDIISSYLIFNDKDQDFYDWIDSYEPPAGEDITDDAVEEMEHLRILRNYYTEMGIENRFTDVEMEWHSSFKDALAI